MRGFVLGLGLGEVGLRASGYRTVASRLIALFTLLISLGCLAFALPTSAQTPSVPQGGNATFLKTGSDFPGTNLVWDIILNGNTSSPVATSNNTGGWSVSFNTTSLQFTVGAPSNAIVSSGYEVRYRNGRSGTYSATFAVVLNGGGVLTLSLNVAAAIGGTPAVGNGVIQVVGTVVLAQPAPTGGAVITLSSSNTSAAAVPANFTIPAGAAWGTFNVTTLVVSSNLNTTISASYSSAVATAGLNVIPGALQLTPVGLAEGFGLSLFAAGFNQGVGGPFACCPYGAGVLVTDWNNEALRVFPTDVDGQWAPNVPTQSYFEPKNVVVLDDKIYLAYQLDQNNAELCQVSATGAKIQDLVTIPNGCTNILADPFRHLIYAANSTTIYRLDPVAKTLTPWANNLGTPDGMALSGDGRTLYAALDGANDVMGFDTTSGAVVFDLNTNPSGTVFSGPDGLALGGGVLAGKLYVNCNDGTVYEINLATVTATLIASGGTRGDYATADPNGSLFLSQRSLMLRLSPPAGGSFRNLSSSIIATRDDLTNPNTTPYSALALTNPQTSADEAIQGKFDATGLFGGVVGGQMQRGGQAGWSSGATFDLTLGLRSASNSLLTTYGSTFSGFQTNTTNPAAYTSVWNLPPSYLPGVFEMDIQNQLGNVYNVKLTDLLGNTSTTYTVTDTPEFYSSGSSSSWPSLGYRNILTVVNYPTGNPAIAQGRALDLTLPWLDTPSNGTWEIVQNGTVIASSVSPNGWSVEQDNSNYYGAWVTVPTTASVGVGYEVRTAHNYGSGFFDVVASTTTAPVMLPLTASPSTISGGNSSTGTITLDAPAPTGGATITLQSLNGGVSVSGNVTIPAGQQSATFTISTTTTTVAYETAVFASYNGVRALSLIVVPSGGSIPTPPQNLTAVGASSQVTLAWNTPTSGAALYNVYRSLTHLGPYTKIATGVLPTSYLDQNVVNVTTYYYVVTAYNNVGESGYSNEASATPNAGGTIFGLTLTPSSVVGSQYSIGTVTLVSPAPTGGTSVTLTSANSLVAAVPASVLVPQNQKTAQFAIQTTPVTADANVLITATLGSSNASATLTVQAPSVQSLTFTPNPVTGGTASTGTVTLNGPTFNNGDNGGGATITLSSGNTAVATVPATVTITAGKRTATFTVNTSSVNSSTQVPITATGSLNSKGTITANLTVNPTSINVYLANLTLSPTGIVGAGSGTATVTLSGAAPTGGAVVPLKSSDPSVTVPASVTVLAGQQIATFTYTTSGGVGNISYVTLSGSYNTWTQAAILTEMPTGYNLTVQNLSASGGNGCAVLNWTELPQGSIRGYNVYRIVNGTPVLLNATPLPSSVYSDTGLTNSNTYQYQIAVVDLLGNVDAPSGAVSATTTAAAPTVSWVTPLPTTVSGTTLLYASQSAGAPSYCSLLVDGQYMSDTTTMSAQPNSTIPGPLAVKLFSAALVNGMHTLQLVGSINGNAFTTGPVQIGVSNSFSASMMDPFLTTYDGSMMQLQATMPAGTTQTTIQILNSNNTIVRSWQTSSSSFQLAWDGTDATGATVQPGVYTLQKTSQGTGGTQQTTSQVDLVTQSPTALALIDDVGDEYGFDIPYKDTWDNFIGNFAQTMFTSDYGPNSCVLLHNDITGGLLNPNKAADIIAWMGGTVQAFYLYSHGHVPPLPAGQLIGGGGVALEMTYSNLTFYPNPPTDPVLLGWIDARPLRYAIISNLSRQGQYQFVFLDACHSAGGGHYDVTVDPSEAMWAIGVPDPTWANAFKISTYFGDTAVFIGFNGDAGANVSLTKDGSDFGSNQWYWWRYEFMRAMLNYDVDYAIYHATSRATSDESQWTPYIKLAPSINPWDVSVFGDPRTTVFGDFYWPWY